MSWTKSAVIALALGIGSTAFVAPAFAEDAAEEKKEVKKEEKKEVKGPKLSGYWGKLASLTLEQKIKIKEIRDKCLDEKKKLDDKEEADITGLLPDEQKVELQGLKEEDAAKRKAKDAEKAKPAPKKEEEKKDGM